MQRDYCGSPLLDTKTQDTFCQNKLFINNGWGLLTVSPWRKSWFGESLKEFPNPDFSFQNCKAKISQPNLQDGCAQNLLVMGRGEASAKSGFCRENFRFSWDNVSHCLKLSHNVSLANILILPMSETLSHQPLSPPTSVDSPTAADDVWLMITEILLNQGCSTKKTGKILKWTTPPPPLWRLNIQNFTFCSLSWNFLLHDQGSRPRHLWFFSFNRNVAIGELTDRNIEKRKSRGEKYLRSKCGGNVFFAILRKENGAKVFRRTGYLEELDIWEGALFHKPFYQQENTGF